MREQQADTPRVRVGIGLSPDMVRADRAQLVDVIARINDSSIGHLFAADHVSFRGGRGHDAITAMHYLAGLGFEGELHIGVLILPLRHPTLVARQILDLADVHRHGVVLGVGIGGEDPAEYSMVGVDSKERGARMNDALPLLIELLGPQAPVERGGYYPAEGPGLVRASPDRIPVLVGGRADRALVRASEADGWLAAFSSPSRFAAGAERVRSLSGDAVFGYQGWIGIGADGQAHVDRALSRFYGIDPKLFERYVTVGGAAEFAEHFEPYVAAGASILNLSPAGEIEAAIDEISTVSEMLNS